MSTCVNCFCSLMCFLHHACSVCKSPLLNSDEFSSCWVKLLGEIEESYTERNQKAVEGILKSGWFGSSAPSIETW